MSPSVSVRLLLTQSDARLVAYAHAGHERAFEALVQRYRRSLLGYCRRLLLSDERAEDALQQALLQAWLALRSGTEVANAKAWLFRIVHNSALNTLRVSGYDYCKLSESLSGAGAPQEDLDRRIAVREALAGLAALPEMQREALLRTAVEGNSHQQVARELGLSENALRGLVYRARATLRAAAGAILPPPLVSWALGSGGRGAPLIERLAELGVGGGSAGVTGLLMKGGAVAVTASVMAGGIAAVHDHPNRGRRHTITPAFGHLASSATTSPAVAQAHLASITPTRSIATLHARGQSHSHRPLPPTGHKRRRPTDMPFTTRIAAPPPPPPQATHTGAGHKGRKGSEEDNQGERPGPNVQDGELTAGSTGRGGEGNRQTGADDGRGSSSHDARDGSSSSDSSAKSPSGDSRSDSSSDTSEGDRSPGTSGQDGSPENRGSSEASSSTTTNSPSKNEQGEEEGGKGD